MKNNLQGLLIPILFLSCAFDQDNELQCVKTYYPDGLIKKSACFIGDSIEHGITQEYYNNGILAAEIPYLGGKKHGLVNLFHRNGKIMEMQMYNLGTKHGEFKWYFDSGELMAERTYLNGNLDKEGFDYLKNGSISRYRYYNLDGELVYDRIYTKDNENIFEEKGTAFPVVMVNNQVLPLGSTLRIVYYPINPPRYLSKLEVEIQWEDGSTIKVPVNHHYRAYEILFAPEKLGKFIVKGTLSLTNHLRNDEYSTQIEITVL